MAELMAITTATINNNGNGPMTFSSFAVSSTSFKIDSNGRRPSLTNDPPPVAHYVREWWDYFRVNASGGALTGTLTVTDNSLNAPTATQLIPLVGTGIGLCQALTGGDQHGVGGECCCGNESVTFTPQ